jgi:hypothetical protein
MTADWYWAKKKLHKVDFQPFCFAIDTFLVRYFFLFWIQYWSIGSESLQYHIRYSDIFLVRYFDTFFCIR